MKSVLHISPESVEIVQLNLLLEIGNNGMSMLWYQKHPMKIEGLSVYAFEKFENNVSAISSVFQNNEIAHIPAGNISVFLNFKESILIPDKFYDPELSESMLSLLFGEAFNCMIRSDHVDDLSVHNVYRLPKDTVALIDKYFPNASVIHSTNIQSSIPKLPDMLRCIIVNDIMKIILFKSGELQFVQQFNFKSPEDAAYHLLNTCQQHGVNPETIPVRLSGMVAKASSLFECIYNYFIDIEFEQLNPEIEFSANFESVPSHFFYHLTELAACV